MGPLSFFPIQIQSRGREENGDQVGEMSEGRDWDMFKVERFKRTGTASGYPHRNLMVNIST